MAKYRKKPVVVDAVKWDGGNHREMFDFLTGTTDRYLYSSGEHFYIDHNRIAGGLIIKTLEGDSPAAIGDYIVKGVAGEFYPCKPHIFVESHEKVEE